MGGLATGFSGGKPDVCRYRQIAGQGYQSRAPARSAIRAHFLHTGPTIVKGHHIGGSAPAFMTLSRPSVGLVY